MNEGLWWTMSDSWSPKKIKPQDQRSDLTTQGSCVAEVLLQWKEIEKASYIDIRRGWRVLPSLVLASVNKGVMCFLNSVQSLSHVQLLATPWTAAREASLSITNCQSLLKLMSIESVMTSKHLILCRPLLLPPIFPSIRVFSSESAVCTRWSKYWNFSFHISP